jgi:signal recognition particle receptor subunit beta
VADAERKSTMPLVNQQRRELNCKIVYYGAAYGGKTTNLQYIHSQLNPNVRGELITLQTETDRTIYFDFLPVDVGEVNGWKVRLSLYTVPGQVHYVASRKLILNGADAIVFVADSDLPRIQENHDSMQDMVNNLSEFGVVLQEMPWVMQYNKRDLTTAASLEQLEMQLNVQGVPSVESIAYEGMGVFSTLRAVTRLLLNQLASLVD